MSSLKFESVTAAQWERAERLARECGLSPEFVAARVFADGGVPADPFGETGAVFTFSGGSSDSPGGGSPATPANPRSFAADRSRFRARVLRRSTVKPKSFH